MNLDLLVKTWGELEDTKNPRQMQPHFILMLRKMNEADVFY